MTNIMIQISAYMLMAILLGYFFGWLTTKVVLKNRYQNKLEEFTSLKDELFQYKKENKELKNQIKNISSGYDGQKYVLNEHNEILDEFQKRLLSKDEVIETLTSKLSLAEKKQMEAEKKYEEEIDAFMFERIEITKKYKELLAKHNLVKQHKSILYKKEPVFFKFFSSPSKVH